MTTLIYYNQIIISTIKLISNMSFTYLLEPSAAPEGPKQFCFVYVNFGYETWVEYLWIIGATLMVARSAYIFYRQSKRTKLFKTEMLIYLMLLCWAACGIVRDLMAVSVYNTLSEVKDEIPLDTYNWNTTKSKQIYTLEILCELFLQSMIIFLYSNIILYTNKALADSKREEWDNINALNQEDAVAYKLSKNYKCLTISVKGMVVFAFVRFLYLLFLTDIFDTGEHSSTLSGFTTYVGAIDPQIMLFPGCLLIFFISSRPFEDSLTHFLEHLKIQNAIRTLPLLYAFRAFSMIVLFGTPKWYTFEQQKCNINKDEYTPFELTTVAIIYNILLHMATVHQILNAVSAEYKPEVYGKEKQTGRLKQDKSMQEQKLIEE